MRRGCRTTRQRRRRRSISLRCSPVRGRSMHPRSVSSTPMPTTRWWSPRSTPRRCASICTWCSARPRRRAAAGERHAQRAGPGLRARQLQHHRVWARRRRRQPEPRHALVDGVGDRAVAAGVLVMAIGNWSRDDRSSVACAGRTTRNLGGAPHVARRRAWGDLASSRLQMQHPVRPARGLRSAAMRVLFVARLAASPFVDAAGPQCRCDARRRGAATHHAHGGRR